MHGQASQGREYRDMAQGHVLMCSAHILESHVGLDDRVRRPV